MGVRRAVETTLKTVQHSDGRIATYGPLIHNPQVLQLLDERGVDVLSEIPAQHNGTVIIRAHGVPPQDKERLESAGARVQDATCPRVMKVQAIIKKHKKEGRATVIIGDKNHAEVIGLMGYAAPAVHVVSSLADADELQLVGPYIIVSQTTQDEQSFQEYSARIMARFPQGKVFDTICDSTHKRQHEVRVLCQQVEAIVVVGGKSSANTQRLGEIATGMGRPVFMCENEADLDLAALGQFDVVGVTAGASTPTWMINRVIRQIEAVPGRQEGPFSRLIRRLVWFLLMTNIYVSGGGGLLAMAIAAICGGVPPLAAFTIAFGYLLAMHNINRFVGLNFQGASGRPARPKAGKRGYALEMHPGKINDPVQERFCRHFCRPILVLSGMTLVFSGALVWQLGSLPFVIFIAMSFFGSLYGSHIFPHSLQSLFKVKGLKEIPGSKTFLVALAWSLVVVILPCWPVLSERGGVLLVLGLLMLGVIYVRNALFDVFDVQGDKMVGKETLPVCIGERRTLQLLTRILLLLAGLTVAGIATPLPMAGLLFLPGIFLLWIFVSMYRKERIFPGLASTFMLETTLYILALSLGQGRLFF